MGFDASGGRSLGRLMSRFVVGIALPAVAVGTWIAVVRGDGGPAPSPSGAGPPSRVAMSSPVDPQARFPWEMSPPPRSLVPLEQIVSGGPPPDGIPAIDAPRFETVAAASRRLDPAEPVLAFELGRDARAYPLQVLIWHEIVNDIVAGSPVTVTYCPLCNSAIVFDRRAAGRVLDFGTSGRLYHSDLVMYDRQTKSLWPQILGKAVAGRLIGHELTVLPSQVVSWGEWRAANPGGKVLSRATGFDRPYGQNPYVDYDTSDPFLFSGRADGRLPAIARVVAVSFGGKATVYPYEALARGRTAAVHDRVGGRDIVVFFARGTASALDEPEVARGRDVGATGVFAPEAGGRRLTFDADANGFVDRETRSRWSILGRAVAGPLEGSRLRPLAHVDTFWFAWAAFSPEAEIWRG